MPALNALAVRHAFGAHHALDDVSLAVGDGEVVALVGETGSGKSTLLRCFNRMVEPDQGIVRVGDVDVRTREVTALRRQVGYVPQDGGLLPHWTVRRNVALVPVLLGRPDADQLTRAALELVGLSWATFGDRLPGALSGGQRQRVALARALAAEQQVILLDEPFGALDAISRAEIHDMFLALRQARPFTGVLVTHDLAEAARLADRMVVMRAGRVEQEATLAQLQAAPATPYVAALLARARAMAGALS